MVFESENFAGSSYGYIRTSCKILASKSINKKFRKLAVATNASANFRIFLLMDFEAKILQEVGYNHTNFLKKFGFKRPCGYSGATKSSNEL